MNDEKLLRQARDEEAELDRSGSKRKYGSEQVVIKILAPSFCTPEASAEAPSLAQVAEISRFRREVQHPLLHDD